MPSFPVRVLIADDQTLMREGLASLLEIQDGIAVVGTAGDGAEAVEQALALAPDVVLMDVRMPGMDGVAATARLRERLPACRVLMLTTFDDDEYVAEALRAGASGYLLKDIPAGDLAPAIQAVHSGVYQLAPSVAGKLLAALHPAPAPPQPAPADVELTAREREVLRLIAAGATNREIAAALVVSEGTVKNHISSILGRLGLRDRTQAAIYAHAHGLS
ncbi:MAG TPA: response regulator transcription factor [Herpetosiphonaceae bacterium]|nr:response regulator transcription factor [Herpetosiphonaceae bacterium]